MITDAGVGTSVHGDAMCIARRHGTRAAYGVDRCRCPEARAANREYAAQRNRRLLHARFGAEPPLTVPAERAIVEINRLRAGGWGCRRLAAALDVGRDYLARIEGKTARPIHRVTWANYQKLVVLPDTPDIADGSLVDATGTHRRLEALIVLGYPKTYLARRITGGVALQFKQPQVLARTVRTVAALYEELSATPGPSDRARLYGQRHGYAPPLAWDDDTIDDPAAQPTGIDLPRHKPNDARHEDEAFLRSVGCSDHEIARRLGVTVEAIERRRFRPRAVAS